MNVPEIISRSQPELAASLENCLADVHRDGRQDASPHLPWETVTARSGAPTVRVGNRFLHSSIDPHREAERVARSVLESRIDPPDVIVIFGTGMGYHIEALRRAQYGIHLVVLEPVPSLLQHALDHLDPEWWCRYGPHRVLAASQSERVVSILGELAATRPAFFALPALEQLFPDQAQEIRQALETYRSRREVNRNTVRRFGRLWVRNTIRNLSVAACAPGIELLDPLPSAVPALVCGAGPTLDDLEQHMNELCRRCFVIAVDTAVSVLQRWGITPHVILIADPQYWNTRHMDRIKGGSDLTRTSVLVAESATHPRAFRLWNGKTVLFASLFPLGSYFDARTGRSRKLGAGGSVATSAWDLARILGCRSIFLAGVDLGFPRNQTHCRGSFFEERIIMNAHRLKPAEQDLFRYLRDAEPEMVPSAGGGEILSDRRMHFYRSWFAEQRKLHPEASTKFLSPHSSRIEGLETMDPEELIASFPAVDLRGVDLHGRNSTEQVTRGMPRKDPAERLGRSLHQSISQIASIAREGITVCSRLLEKEMLTVTDLALLDQLDRRISAHADREVAGFLAGEALHGITRMKVNTPRDAVTQAQELYSALSESCSYHQELLQRYHAE